MTAVKSLKILISSRLNKKNYADAWAKYIYTPSAHNKSKFVLCHVRWQSTSTNRG